MSMRALSLPSIDVDSHLARGSGSCILHREIRYMKMDICIFFSFSSTYIYMLDGCVDLLI